MNNGYVDHRMYHVTDDGTNFVSLTKQQSVNGDLVSPRVFAAQAECIVDPDNSTQELCSVNFRNDGVLVHTDQAVNGTDMFQSYGLNVQPYYNTNTTGDMAFQTLMIFDKKLNKCETYLLDKYVGLKLGKALKSSFNFNQSRTGFTNSSRILGFDPIPSVACSQDIFLSQTSSGFMEVGFEIDNPSVSDYDIIARDEYLIVGHNGADVASLVDISNMATPPSLPAGSSVTDVLERKWLVDFKSVSGVAAPIKQISLKYDFTLGGLDLSAPNYPKPYLIIQRGNVPIEIEGYYQGEDSVAFDPIDFQHGDTVQLAFNQNAANNPPTSSNHSIFIDSTHAFSANDFKFSDPDNDAFYQVRITVVPTQGTLTLNGSPVNNGDVILVSDLAGLSLNFDNTATLPISMKYEVSDGLQWSNESDLSINQLKIHHQLSPEHVTYRVGDEVNIHTLAELNYQPLSVSVDYVWWTVNSANDIGEYYDPNQHTALSVEDSYTISSSSVGKYLLAQAEYTEPTSGQSVKSVLPIGLIEAANLPTRPTVAWASQLNVNSQYVYENLTIEPELALRDDDEVLPPEVAYCFYDEDTGSVLQACGVADTFLVTSVDKDKTIRVEAILTDSNNPTIEAQTLTAYLFPRATSNNLSRPVISPTRDLTLNSTISLTPEPRFQASNTLFQWYRYKNGQYTPINGANQASYTTSWADMSATILLQVTVDDNGIMVPIESNMTENVEYQLAVDMVLGHETPLHVDDEITLLNQSSVEQAVQGLVAQNGNFVASYTWQYSINNGTGWFDQATLASIQPLTSLTDSRIYRLRLDISGGLAPIDVYSNNSPAVQSGLSYNIDVEPLSAPIEDVSYDVYSQLTSSLGTSYGSRTHQWSRVEADGTLTPLSTGGVYTPTSNDVGFPLRVTISYLDVSNNVLVSRAIETPLVQAAPSSTSVIDTLNALHRTLVPTELSVGMSVSLNQHDISLLAQSGLTVDYHWQNGQLGGSWTGISGATDSHYTAQTGDASKALQLCITLTDAASSVSESVCSYPTQTVTDNNTGYALRTVYLTLDSVTDTLSLTEASQTWLDNLLTTESLTATYQWYRIPQGGSIDSGGAPVGMGSNNYTLVTSIDVGYQHALRVALSNGDVVNSDLSDLSDAWGGVGSSAPNSDDTFQNLYLDLVRIESLAAPQQVGDVVTARLLGSTPEHNQQPDDVQYQWQRSNDGINWSNISTQGNEANYQLTSADESAGEVRVIATPIVGGNALTALVSASMSVVSGVTERLSIALTPSLIPLPQSEVLGVVLLEQPSGANLTYQWYRLPGVLGGSDVWPVSTEITGATANNYTVTADDQGYYLGVIVTDTGGSTLSARALSAGFVAETSTSDRLMIQGDIATSPLIEGVIPTYTAQLLRNSSIDLSNSANIVANWYLLDTPTQRDAKETWTALAQPLSNESLLGQAGKHLLLELRYSEAGMELATTIVLSEPIEPGLIKPILSYERPVLSEQDRIEVLNQNALSVAESQLLAKYSQFTVNYTWQSTNNNSSWVTVSTPSSFAPLSSLVADEQYRFVVNLTESGNPLATLYSDESIAVTALSLSTDYDIAYNTLNAPIEGVSYQVVSQLISSATASYGSRTHQWSRVEADGTLAPLSTDVTYTPTNNDVGRPLRVTISYLDVSNNVLVSRVLETPLVQAAPSSTSVIDTLNALHRTLVPTELSVGMSVSLNQHDLSLLAQSGLTVDYHWQNGQLGGSWAGISGATDSHYTAQTGDASKALQLCITLTDAASSVSESVCSYPTQTVTDNNTGYALRTVYLTLDSVTDTLSLTEASQTWLDNLLTTESLTATYQWYRIPQGGSIDSGGTPVGMGSNNYTLMTPIDVGYQHALRVTLSNGDVVNSDLSDAWGGAGSSAPNSDDTFQNLYLDVVRIESLAAPQQVGDVVTARLLSSTPEHNQQPDDVQYQWQRSSDGINWSDISTQGNEANYQLTSADESAGEVRVIATPLWVATP